MGLDMYLEVEEYIQRPMEWRELTNEETARYNAIRSVLSGEPSEDSFGVTVSYTVAYWRKANQIHKWFVDNVQDGVDECQRSYVTIDQLHELLSICEQVLAHATLIDGHFHAGQHRGPDTGGQWVDDYAEGKVVEAPEIAAALLPRSEGFFFGGTGYDERYLRDVEHTATTLTAILNQFQDKRVSFYYQSSW